MEVALTWRRYLRSLSGRHACPRCDTTFRLQITRRYLLLWVDILAVAIITGALTRMLLIMRFDFARNDMRVLTAMIAVPALIWGSVFLVLNRRALDRLDTKPVFEESLNKS